MSSIQNRMGRESCGSEDEVSIWQYVHMNICYAPPPPSLFIRVQVCYLIDNSALNSGGEDVFFAKRHYQRWWPFCWSQCACELVFFIFFPDLYFQKILPLWFISIFNFLLYHSCFLGRLTLPGLSALDVNALIWFGIEIELPEIEDVVSFTSNGASAWADTFRIDALLKNGSEKSYFLKVWAP